MTSIYTKKKEKERQDTLGTFVVQLRALPKKSPNFPAHIPMTPLNLWSIEGPVSSRVLFGTHQRAMN